MKDRLLVCCILFSTLLTGCNNAVESNSAEIPPMTSETLFSEEATYTTDTKDTQIGQLESEMPEQYVYLSEEQKRQIKSDHIEQACTTLSNCLINDTNTLNDSAVMLANTSLGLSLEGITVSTQSFDNEMVYYAQSENHSEIWHKLTFETKYISTKEYLAGLKEYMCQYDVTFEEKNNILSCKNVYDTNQTLYLTATETNVWVGLADCKLKNFNILNTYG